MNRVVITGADGFIGSQVVKFFLKKGLHVIAIDRRKQPNRLKEEERLTYLSVDLAEEEALFEKVKEKQCDTWYHFAWEGVARETRAGYESVIRSAITTVRCMEVAKRAGCTRFVGVGSVCEKEVVESIFAQQSNMDGTSFYGVGKLLAHGLCKIVSEQIGIEYIGGMIANTYGEGGSDAQFINRIVNNLLLGKEIDCTEGIQYYDFVYITDVANAFYLMGEQGVPGAEYMIGSGNPKPLKEFLIKIEELLEKKGKLRFGAVPFKGTLGKKEMYDISQLQTDTGFAPKISFEEGISRTVKWITDTKKQE